MQIIISHINTDFDALASMLAAKKLYPNAQMVLSDKQNIPVSQYLAIYRDKLDLAQDKDIQWSEVRELILVDEAALSRIGNYVDQLQMERLKITVYDHHPPSKRDVEKDEGIIESVGAAVTLLIEEIRKRSLPISPFEATLFGLGIYTDTGSFTYNNTTARDFQAASYLMEQGMNLEIIQRFSDEILLPEQQEILNQLFQNSTTHYIKGLEIVTSLYQHHNFQKGIATFTQKLMEITNADAVLAVVGMKNRIYVVGRASADRISLLPLLKKWKGGGHEQAGSATIKNGDLEAVFQEVNENLNLMIKPPITAQDMMASPVKTILPETSIEESGRLMYRYGHTGFPVVKDGELLGIITRRDLEKATHHGLGHAPVKAYMSTNVVSIEPQTTEEEIQNLIIERNVGRLPVVENGKLIGIVSRTNVIEVLHNQKRGLNADQSIKDGLHDNLKAEMKEQLPEEVYSLLKDIGQTANEVRISVYLIGGIVRDILLRQPNDDIDIVVEGDGIAFSKRMQKDYGGNLITHEKFGTATWTHVSGLEIDVTSSRLEYYDRPGALPDVENSTLKEDLYRRDFTINAMAIYLNLNQFGQVIDPFRGQLDLKEKRVKVLHNLSFIEDPTRILRGVRFEIRFGFLMDEQTEKLALHSIDRVKDLSVNRIADEMVRLFSEHDLVGTMQRLFELQFWQQFDVCEEMEKPSCDHVNRLQTLSTGNKPLSISDSKPSWFNYFMIPFYSEGKLKEAKRFALTKRNRMLFQEVIILKDFDKWQQIKKIGEFQRYLKDYSEEAILFFVSKNSFKNEKLILTYLKKRRNLTMFLTGEDLIEQGLKPSTFFSELLLDHEEAILNDEVKTKDEAKVWLQNQLSKLDFQ